MDILSYQIFINLLVNHIKYDFVKYRQFILIFALARTAILFRFLFFSRCKKLIHFFVQ